MSFKKLKSEVVEALKFIAIDALPEADDALFSTIKSGKNLIIQRNDDNTTLALVSLFNKVNIEYEGSPRAIFLTDTVEHAEAFHKKAAMVCRKLDITTDVAHDKGNMIQQRNDIFDGTEIVVGNPKRVHDLYIQNGINFKLLDLVIIDHFDGCIAAKKQSELKRIIDALEPKTQLICFAKSLDRKTNLFIENFEVSYTLIAAE